MSALFTQQVRINGRKYAVVACPTSYLPQFRTPANGYTAFVCGNVCGSTKVICATPEQAIAAAQQIAARLNGAFFPTVDGFAPSRI